MGGEQELREPETTEESMTVRGHYRITGSDTTPAPFVQARVWVRGAGAHVPVEFLVSTGAAVTLLAPGDVRNLGIGPDDLDRDTLRTSTGVWGAVAHYDAPAELIFQGEELQAACWRRRSGHSGPEETETAVQPEGQNEYSNRGTSRKTSRTARP